MQSKYSIFVLLLFVMGKTDAMIGKLKYMLPPLCQNVSYKNNLMNKMKIRPFCSLGSNSNNFEDIKKLIDVHIKAQNYLKAIQEYDEIVTCQEIEIEEIDHQLNHVDNKTFGDGANKEKYSKTVAYKEFKDEIEKGLKEEKKHCKEKINCAKREKNWYRKKLEEVDDIYCDLSEKLHVHFTDIENWYLTCIDSVDHKGTLSSKPPFLADTLPCINWYEKNPQKIVMGDAFCKSERKKTEIESLRDHYLSNQKYCHQCLCRIVWKYQKMHKQPEKTES